MAVVDYEVRSMRDFAEGEVITCEQCGAVLEEDEDFYEIDGKFYHGYCLGRAGFEFCEDCGSLVNNDDIRYVNDAGYICTSCIDNSYHYFFCDSCCEWYDDRRNSRYGDGNMILCECCRDDYRYCNNCDTLVHEDSVYWFEDEPYCYDCYQEQCSNALIHNYGYKPDPKYKCRSAHKDTTLNAVDIKDLLFGVELEVDRGDSCDRRDCAEAVVNVGGDNVYLKEDGSLDTGFEIVTHPCTLDYHMFEFPWRGICKEVLAHGFKSHDARTCGLHVHVGRYQLGETPDERRVVAAKIILLMHMHWDKLVKFSRRKLSQLDRWACRPNAVDVCFFSNELPSDWGTTDRLMHLLSYNDDNRYMALNLQNRYTIEFRLFNGSLRRDTIAATLQLTSNICKYAMAHSVEDIINSSWNDVISIEFFPELTAYCESRGLSDKTDAVITVASDNEVESAVDMSDVLANGDRVCAFNGITTYVGTIVITPSSSDIETSPHDELIYGMHVDEVDRIIYGRRSDFATLSNYNPA